MLQPLARKLVSLAAECQDTQIWARISLSLRFLVQIPGREHPVAVGVIGDGDYGLQVCLFIDDEADDSMDEMFFNLEDEGIFAKAHVVAFYLDPARDVTGAFRRVLKDGDYRPQGARPTPHFMANPMGEGWRPIQQGEARLLALCLHAVLRAQEGGVFTGGWKMTGTIELTLSSDAIEGQHAPEVTWDPALPDVECGLEVRPDTLWAAQAWHLTPRGPQDADDDYLLAVLDVDADLCLGIAFINGVSKAASFLAFETISQCRPWRPETLIVQPDWLHANLMEDLHAVGSDVHSGAFPAPIAQELDLIRRHHARRYNLDLARDGELGTGEADDRPLVIAPSTVEAWSEVIAGVIERLVEHVPTDHRKRATTEYWGSEDAADDLHEALLENGAASSFDDWLVTDDCADGDLTFVQKALALPEGSVGPVGDVLEALAKSTLSIFAIEALGGGEISLEDLATGATCQAFCGAIYGRVAEILYVPLRVLELNRHRICRVAGPPLDSQVVRRLRSERDGVLKALKDNRRRQAGPQLGAIWLEFSRTFVPEEHTAAAHGDGGH